MAWKLVWSSFAEQQIAAIHEYYLNESNAQVAKKIAAAIIKSPTSLIKNLELGQLEPSLSELQTEYRYISYKSYKIIYSIVCAENQIKVANANTENTKI
jgi:plasmid stabilization system protein ParE